MSQQPQQQRCVSNVHAVVSVVVTAQVAGSAGQDVRTRGMNFSSVDERVTGVLRQIEHLKIQQGGGIDRHRPGTKINDGQLLGARGNGGRGKDKDAVKLARYGAVAILEGGVQGRVPDDFGFREVVRVKVDAEGEATNVAPAGQE